METANFIALLWGFSAIIISFACLIRPKHLKTALAAMEHEQTLLLLSMLSVFLGLASVLAYNTWNSSWQVIITILGWLLIIKGGLYLFVPEVALSIIEKAKKNYINWAPIALVVKVLFGCILVYFGLTV